MIEMKRIRAAVAALAILTAGCVRQTHVVKGPAPISAPAAPSMWDRQIRNAVNAGDGDYRLKTLRDKIAADPDNIPARLELAKAYQERGYADVALEICRLAAARFPESGDVQLALVKALRDMNRRQDAIDGLEAFLKAHPENAPEYFSWLGILRDETGLWTTAEPAHRKALELAPSVDYLHNNLGYNLLMQNKNDEAAAEFREALKLNPSSQLARNNLGVALANQDAGKQAIANWQSASDPATAHSNLAAVWIEKGNYSEARKELEIALGYNRSHSAALKNLELVSRLEGKPAVLTVQPSETRWERWKAGVKKLFVGPLDDTRREPAKTASVPATGEKQ
jgi:Flp pilus assembly protein TadD